MERFSQKRRVLSAVAVSAALLVPLGIFGGPALAGMGSAFKQYSGSSQYQYKVTICHHTHSKKHPMHTISVGAPAVKAHLKHHDTLGACPGTAAPQTAAKHGKAKGHEKSQGAPAAQQSQSGNNGKAKGHADDHGNAGGNGKGKGK